MAGGDDVPVAENLPKSVLRFAGPPCGCQTDADAHPDTGVASTEPGSGRKPDAESADVSGRV